MVNSDFPYTWNPKYAARIGIMPREGTDADVRWFEIDPCFVFHPLGAYDDGSRVVLDVVRHPRMFDSSPLVPNEGAPRLERWIVDLERGSVTQEVLADQPLEFPRRRAATGPSAPLWLLHRDRRGRHRDRPGPQT